MIVETHRQQQFLDVIDRDLAERSYDMMVPNYSYDGTIATEGLKASIDLIAKRSAGTARKTFSPSDMLDFSLLEEARREEITSLDSLMEFQRSTLNTDDEVYHPGPDREYGDEWDDWREERGGDYPEFIG